MKIKYFTFIYLLIVKNKLYINYHNIIFSTIH